MQRPFRSTGTNDEHFAFVAPSDGIWCLDGLIDEAAYCRRDVDVDGDGYCPIGTDLRPEPADRASEPWSR